MNFDPQRFFISLMDFFSILLLGARLCRNSPLRHSIVADFELFLSAMRFVQQSQCRATTFGAARHWRFAGRAL